MGLIQGCTLYRVNEYDKPSRDVPANEEDTIRDTWLLRVTGS
jgi:hypothetical protein